MLYQLVKSNFILNPWWGYAGAFFALMAYNSAQLPSIFMLILIIMTFIINQFYYDQQSSTNRFLISLPVPKKAVVQSRYITIIILTILFVFIQWGFGKMERGMHYIFSWQDIIAASCLIIMIAAILIPIFYLIPSFAIAIGTIIFLMFFGVFIFIDILVSVLNMDKVIVFNDLDPGLYLLVEKYIPVQPYPILILSTFIFLYLSIRFSELIYSSRDF